MKFWTQSTIGIGVGVVVGALLPLAGGDTAAFAADMTQLVVIAGRLFVVPLVFFGAIVAADELRDARRLSITLATAAGVVVAVVIVASILGMTSVLVLQPQRIPPLVQEGRLPDFPGIVERIVAAVPLNLFRALVSGDDALGVVLLVAILIGVVLRSDREITAPVSLVADSANHVFFFLVDRLMVVYGFLLAVPAGAMVLSLRGIEDVRLYGQLLLAIIVASTVLVFIVFPIALASARRGARALSWLQHAVGATAPTLVTGDHYVSLGSLARVANGELRISRRIGGIVTPVTMVIARSGTALVAAASFLLVLRSYTALDIGLATLLQVLAVSIGGSFLLGGAPGRGVLLLLTMLAFRHGRGMEESYLILMPVIPLLERIAAWTDAMTAAFVTQLLEGMHRTDAAR